MLLCISRNKTATNGISNKWLSWRRHSHANIIVIGLCDKSYFKFDFTAIPKCQKQCKCNFLIITYALV